SRRSISTSPRCARSATGSLPSWTTSRSSDRLPTPKKGTSMAPFELVLFSFLDARGVEQSFTTADADAARAHAASQGLVVLKNTYEFVTSEPVADFTGAAVVISHD